MADFEHARGQSRRAVLIQVFCTTRVRLVNYLNIYGEIPGALWDRLGTLSTNQKHASREWVAFMPMTMLGKDIPSSSRLLLQSQPLSLFSPNRYSAMHGPLSHSSRFPRSNGYPHGQSVQMTCQQKESMSSQTPSLNDSTGYSRSTTSMYIRN